jgi:hypothetical protein
MLFPSSIKLPQQNQPDNPFHHPVILKLSVITEQESQLINYDDDGYNINDIIDAIKSKNIRS